MFKKDSLKKTLLMNYPGCKSAVEAFQFQKNSKLNQTPSEIPKKEDPLEFIAMREAIKSIELSLKDFDIGSLSTTIRKYLADLPINNIDQVKIWRDEWLKVGEKYGDKGSKVKVRDDRPGDLR